MKDKNKIELKHEDFVKIDFYIKNTQIYTCFCQVCNDKLEILFGKEPNKYDTRTIEKIGKLKENLNTFDIDNDKERHFVSLLKIEVDDVDKFAIGHFYDDGIDNVAICHLYNKKEVATSIFNRMCNEISYTLKKDFNNTNKETIDEEQSLER